MAVRRVHHHGRNVIGRFPSLKMGRMVSFESTIERDYLYVLDFEADILSFAEQPLTITYQHQDKTLRYTPDFHVVRTGPRNLLAECKPDRLVEAEDNRRKFDAAKTWCEERDWEFVVVTEAQLRAGPRLQNIKALTYYARHVVPPSVKSRIFAALEAASAPMTVGALAWLLAPEHPLSLFSCLWHMAFHHEAEVPLDVAPLSMDTPVTLPLFVSRQSPDIHP